MLKKKRENLLGKFLLILLVLSGMSLTACSGEKQNSNNDVSAEVSIDESKEIEEVALEEPTPLNEIIRDEILLDFLVEEFELEGSTIVVTQDDLDEVIQILSLSGLKGVKSLEGVQYFRNIEYLSIDDGEISDLSPLSNLNKLYHLSLGANNISDLSPLKGLKNLNSLDIQDNQIEDFSPIKDLEIENLELED